MQLPVRPTIPQLVPGLMVIESPFSTSGNPGRYLMLTSWKDTCTSPAALVETYMKTNAVLLSHASAIEAGFIQIGTGRLTNLWQSTELEIFASRSTASLICHLLQSSDSKLNLTVTMPQ